MAATGAEPCGDTVVRFFLNSIDIRLPLRATLSFAISRHEIPPALVYREVPAEGKRKRRLMTSCSTGGAGAARAGRLTPTGFHSANERIDRTELPAQKNGRPGEEPKRPGNGSGLVFGHRVGILAQEIERGRFFRREFRLSHLRLLLGDFSEELDIAVTFEAGARRDQTSHDDVFLQAAQVIDLPGDGRFGEDAGGLLEARRGDERIGRERRLGDAEQQWTPGCEIGRASWRGTV